MWRMSGGIFLLNDFVRHGLVVCASLATHHLQSMSQRLSMLVNLPAAARCHRKPVEYIQMHFGANCTRVTRVCDVSVFVVVVVGRCRSLNMTDRSAVTTQPVVIESE